MDRKNIFKRTFSDPLLVISILSIVGIFLLRIYAIYNTNTIQTWDDLGYRKYALNAGTYDINLMTALKALILPNPDILDNTRSIGYHSWLVLALKLYLSGDSEQTFQLANLGLFAIQAIVLFLFVKWATSSNSYACTFTFLYLSSPIVFGLNRWVMTENYLMAGLLIYGFLPAYFVNKTQSPSYRKEIFGAILIAWVMGIFGTLREYAFPYYVLTALAIAVSLLIDKRYDALMAFIAVSFAFITTFIPGWLTLMESASHKVGLSEYYHPLPQWSVHVIQYVIGVALSIAFALMIVLIASRLKSFFDQFYNNRNIRHRSLMIILACNLILLILYSLSIILSESRTARAGIMVMFPLLNTILISIKLLRDNNHILKSITVNYICLFLIFLSWTTLYYQLMVAFDGGKTFAHPAYDLEIYNHPLYLRELRSPDDMHT